jgi:hypothetical protein
VCVEHPIKVTIVIAPAPTIEEENMVEESVDEGDVTEKEVDVFEDVLIEDGEDVNVVEDVVNKPGEDVNVIEDDVNVVGDGVVDGGEDHSHRIRGT